MWSQMPPVDERLPDDIFGALVDAEIEGRATEKDIATLFAEARRWRAALFERFDEADDALERAKRIEGPERAQVMMDFESICDEVDAALDRLDRREGREPARVEDVTDEVEPVVSLLQASWSPSRVVVWFGGPDEVLSERADLAEVLVELGVAGESWADHDPVRLPDGLKAAAMSAPIEDVIGWLLGHANDDRFGASARWLAQLCLVGVGLVARGAMVPLLRHRHRTEGTGTFAVRWHPVLVDDRTLKVFARAAPATVFLACPTLDAPSATRSALVAAVNAVCVQAARQIEAPAPPPRPRSATDLAEVYLGRLDGSSFRAPVDLGQALVRFLDEWAKPVAQPPRRPLVVRLDPPSEGKAWLLQVLGSDPDNVLQPIERAIASHPKQQIQARLVDDVMRAERLVPELTRAGTERRGEAILTEDEAWEVLSVGAGTLVDAGFDLEFPRSGRAPRPSLRLTALDGGSAPSSAQLVHVRWSVLFDDVELSATEIAELAKQAAPLVESNGRWVRIDDADLAAGPRR